MSTDHSSFPPNTVAVKVPSTTANLGPGFDVFGLALDLFYDVVKVKLTQEALSIEVVGKYADLVPKRIEENTAGVVAQFFLEKLDLKGGVHIQMSKGIRPSIGLGSSAASAAATAVALNRLFDASLSQEELIQIAARGEVASAGAAHADNVAAAMLGGFTIVRPGKPPKVIRLTPPKNLEVSVVIPKTSMPPKKTQMARSILPKHVTLRQMVQNISNASTMAAGFLLSDIDLIGCCMVDEVVERVRADLIPCYDEVRRSALESGASGVAISGAGPSMIAIVDSEKSRSLNVAEAMKKAFEASHIKAEAYAVKPAEGAKIVEES